MTGLSFALDVPEWVEISRDDFGASWMVVCSRCGWGEMIYTTHVIETKGKALDDAVTAHLKCEDGDDA